MTNIIECHINSNRFFFFNDSVLVKVSCTVYTKTRKYFSSNPYDKNEFD